MLTYPGFNPIALEIGRVKVHWYGIMYLLGFAGAWWLARRRAAKPGSTWKADDVDDLIFFCMLGVILGGRIGYVLFYGLKFWAADPWYPFKVWEGGMAFHGGLIGAALAVILFAWRRGIAILSYLDLVAAVAPIGLFLVRLTNFINGELWGRPTDVPWAMVFPNGGPVPRHPSQLYEATLEGVVLFIVLGLMVRAGWLKRPGVIAGSFALGYGIARITCEFFREPDVQLGFLWGGLTMGMLLCIPLMLGGIAILAVAFRRKPQTDNG